MALPVPVPPGSTQFPQWGFNQAGAITEARDQAQKLAAMNSGYLDWFSSRADARAAWKGMQGFLGKGTLPDPFSSVALPDPFSSVAAIGDFFARLTAANTWIRIGEVVIGLVLIGIGVNSMLKGRPLSVVTSAAGLASKVVPA